MHSGKKLWKIGFFQVEESEKKIFFPAKVFYIFSPVLDFEESEYEFRDGIDTKALKSYMVLLRRVPRSSPGKWRIPGAGECGNLHIPPLFSVYPNIPEMEILD